VTKEEEIVTKESATCCES